MKTNFREKVAAGLRSMKTNPEAFVFSATREGEVWDEPKILGIPVFHHPHLQHFRHDTTSEDVPFIPLWKSEHDSRLVEMKRFCEAYSDA